MWDDQAVPWLKELIGRVESQECRVMNNLALDSPKTRKKEAFFLYFSILQRKNELSYGQKKIKWNSLFISSRLINVDGKIKWQISLTCYHQHKQKLQDTRLELWIKAKALKSWIPTSTSPIISGTSLGSPALVSLPMKWAHNDCYEVPGALHS